MVGVEQQTKTAKGKPTIEFEIDGEVYETRERDLTAEEVLGYAGKGFGSHYLVELLGRGGQQREYRSPSDPVKVHPGSRFLTVSTGPTPVT